MIDLLILIGAYFAIGSVVATIGFFYLNPDERSVGRFFKWLAMWPIVLFALVVLGFYRIANRV